MSYQIPFFARLCFSMAIILLVIINFLPDDFPASSSYYGEMERAYSQVSNDYIRQEIINEKSSSHSQQEPEVPEEQQHQEVEKMEKVENLDPVESIPSETKETVSEEVIVETLADSVESSAPSNPIPPVNSEVNSAPFKTITFNLAGYDTPLVLYYPLGGKASVLKSAENFCNQNYDTFKLNKEGFQSCVDIIRGEIERITGEFVTVSLPINKETYYFNVNINDSQSPLYAASDFCRQYVSSDVFEQCRNQVAAKLAEEIRLSQNVVI